MPRYSVETRLNPEQVIRKAIAHFGKGGLGLDLDGDDQSACCAYFEGGGGYVRVMVAGGKEATVELETREWDHHVKQFMRQIHR